MWATALAGVPLVLAARRYAAAVVDAIGRGEMPSDPRAILFYV